MRSKRSMFGSPMVGLAIVGLVLTTTSPASATVSGDDGRIAYVTDVDGDLEIYSVNPDASDPVNLTNAHGVEGVPIDDTDPAWSPNGRFIAFTRSVEDVDAEEPTIVSGVWIMAEDGSAQHELVPVGSEPAWSPDGWSIAFVMPSVGIDNGLDTDVIAVFDLTTGETTIVTDPGTWTSQGGFSTSYDSSPVWSPDGTTIYFHRHRTPATPLSAYSEVMALDVATLAATALPFQTRFISGLDVSPDGTSLLTVNHSVPGPPTSVEIHDLVTLVSTPVPDTNLVPGSTFSPSGDRIAISRTDNYLMLPAYLWTMDLDGGDPHKVVQGWDPAWQPVNPYAFGLVDPEQGKWYLRGTDGLVDSFYFGNPGDVPFMGDWDCDGVDTPGLYRQSDGYVYLRNTNTLRIADPSFFFGNPGDLPLAGDFDGDGCDTVAIYRPSNQTFYIINELGSGDQGLGAAETSYVFGNPGDKPFVGDFDGDGIDTVGLHRESTGLVYYRNTHTQGNADAQFIYGDPGDRIVANDWNHDGHDSPGLFRPSRTTVYLRFTNTQGNADAWFMFGEPDWLPVAGTFTAP